ncbi:uncharacterized protein B0I36DRAFT_67341 [Microdochium trichocladiopsis]|uniref:C2H2-type domain-containing protein n=1 Tax=Microdochium trichocladiopsis TaxID=1682393 RepID=A0A9P9BS46_9PEZI|nr:uncharacterized protein B0I36DRAFT_67341 [Microdochium trichocladiopsis]KAH7037525.1 hypothetical protein B0I36DRAFT_67341 [Microdochium trichocladiopsis]
MAPASHSISAIMARSEPLSGGAIAGAVVGSLVGAALVFLVLGFIYFRIKRKIKESEAEAGKVSPLPQPPVARRASFTGPGYSAHPYVPPFPGDELTTKEHEEQPSTSEASQTTERSEPSSFLATADRAAIDGSPPVPMEPAPPAPGIAAPIEQDPLAMEGPPMGVASQEMRETQPEHHEAANASYYDTRISLDSDPPAPGPGSPTAAMHEMYEAQIKESREMNKKKQSTSSVKRFFGTLMKGRQSTQSSNDGSRGVDTPAWTPSAQASRVGTGLESVEMQNAQNLHFPGSRQIFDEPEDMGDFAGPGTGGFAQPPSGRSPIDVAPQTRARRMGTEAQQLARINSWRKDSRIRETTEVDPELPSAVYGSRFGSTDSYYGGGFPQSTAPPAAQPPHSGRQEPQAERPHDMERLKSPEIPEPVYDDQSNGMLAGPQAIATSLSPSPPLSSENFVRPMHVMQPTTSTEKYYHTDYRLENPISPVEGPAISSPEMTTSPELHHNGGNNYVLSSEHHGIDPMDEFLDIPGYDEPRRSSESYDYSVSMGPSSTDPSSGRTPDTRITMSPSPFPMPFQHQVQPHQQQQYHHHHQSPSSGDFAGSSASPEPTQLSPPHGPGSLICDECGRTFDQIHKLNHHKRYHDRKHECPYQGCDKRFGTKTHLDRHINDKHLKSKAFHCTEPGCAYFKGGKAFPRKDNWRRHMVKKHGANQQTFDAMDEGMD